MLDRLDTLGLDCCLQMGDVMGCSEGKGSGEQGDQ